VSFQGKKNVYTCQTCAWKAITVDLVEGVTPFMIGCERPLCEGDAYSAGYVVDQTLLPTHEWYRPDTKEAKRLGRLWRDHLKGGGLKLRKVGS
jgi:hypothetical protein